MSNSNRKRKASKPKKPRKDFPLYAHAAGRWAKKVRGRTHYFTKWGDDPKGKAALLEWLEQKDDLLAGREHRPDTGKLTLYQLCNDKFLAHKEAERDNGYIAPPTFATYVATCEILCSVLGKNRNVESLVSADFSKLKARLAKTRKEVAQRSAIQRVRTIFKFAYDDGLIDRPMRYGRGFDKPSLTVVRRAREKHRAEHGDRMFEAHEIRQILDALKGNPQLRAMVLLAANCAFGQSDISSLPKRALDLDKGWIDYPRPKTAVMRRCPLWPETIQALEAAIAVRPKAKNKADDGLVFLTCRGARWTKTNKAGIHNDAIGPEFAKVLHKLGLKRSRVSFYALRHGFETVGGGTRDQIAVNSIMGHIDQSMAGVYRERIEDQRLRNVAEHVRQWLFAVDGTEGQPTTSSARTAKPQPSQSTTDNEQPGLQLFVG
jgi:integrase